MEVFSFSMVTAAAGYSLDKAPSADGHRNEE
jgi:hypothetical protein